MRPDQHRRPSPSAPAPISASPIGRRGDAQGDPLVTDGTTRARTSRTAVAFAADFVGANLSRRAHGRPRAQQANFKDAVLTRVVLTSSDLGDAVIEGADFSDALIDEKQRQTLCKYASGTNPETGVSARRSLNCGGAGGPARRHRGT